MSGDFYSSEDGTAAFIDWGGENIDVKPDKLSANQQKDIAEKLLALPDFTARLGRLLSTNPKLLPQVTVRYRDVTAQANALIGSSGLPSIKNNVLSASKTATCQGTLPTKPVVLLNNVSGVLRPGSLTLLLGPPGAGKSLLMGVLGGRVNKRNSPHLKVSGEVTYQGVPKDKFVVQRTVGFIPQQDINIGSLTVQETVDFAAACLLPKSRRNWLVEELDALLKSYPIDSDGKSRMSDQQFISVLKNMAGSGGKVQVVLAILGLLNCAHTPVGNAIVRGVSGGERRRVAAAEILVGPQSVIFGDQISNGLDSATTYSVIKFISEAVKALRKTCLLSLLQPAPEVMEIFDDIILMSEGTVLYHGPVERAVDWFNSVGFIKPIRKDACSFLQELTVPSGQLLYASARLLQSSGLTESSRTPAALVSNPPKDFLFPIHEMTREFWQRCEFGAAICAELTEQSRNADKPITWPVPGLYKKAFGDKPLKLALNVWQRQMQLNRRMRAFYGSRIFQAIFMGLLRGSLFWMIPQTFNGGRLILSCNMSNVVFISMMSTPQVQIVFQNKDVFIKQRNDRFFPAWSYSVALFLSQIPQSLLEVITYSASIYFMAGFYYSPGNFFKFLLATFLASNCFAAISRLLACAFPTRVLANASSSLIVLINMVVNGFNILSSDIPWFIRWYYYINPVAYGLQAVNVNELYSPHWMIPVTVNGTNGTTTTVPLGPYVLETFQMPTDPNWFWVSCGYLAGLTLLLVAAAAVALIYTNPPGSRPTVSDDRDTSSDQKGVESKIEEVDNAERKIEEGNGEMQSTRQGDAEITRNLRYQMSLQLVREGASISTVRSLRRGTYENVESDGSNGDNLDATENKFQPITLVCTSIRYCVPCPKKAKPSPDADVKGMLQILRGITFFSKPSTLTALMGGSGAGKTTFMDVIAGRKTVGRITGEILVNGHPKNQKTWSRVVGYVEQDIRHTAQLTVREALMFSARLRLSNSQNLDTDAINNVVNSAMDITELRNLSGALTGNQSTVPGLSLEALKRLSIAVELVANPSVIFMDEPTTGLDARAAAVVVRTLKSVAETQRTIVVTIHQPSIDIFESFDNLLLLKRGGRVMYFGPIGPDSSLMMSYMVQQPGVEPMRPGYNPATWMLEVTGSSMSTVFKASDVDFAEVYANSELCKANDDTASALAAACRLQYPPLEQESQYATSLWTRQRWLCWKFWIIYWRSPSYNMARLVITFIIALFYGLVYLNQGYVPSPASISTVQNILGLLFSMAVFVGMFNAINVQQVVFTERVIYYRESASAMYSPWDFSTGTGIAEIPYLIVQTFLMMVLAYWYVLGMTVCYCCLLFVQAKRFSHEMTLTKLTKFDCSAPLFIYAAFRNLLVRRMVGFQANAWKFFYFALMFFTGLACYTYLGQFLVCITPSTLMSMLLSTFISQIWTIVNGFLIPYDQIPVYWQWLNRISPATWIIYGLGTSQLGDLTTQMTDLSGKTVTISQFLQDFFNYDFNFIWQSWVIVLSFTLFFRLGASLGLRYLNFNKR